MSCAGTGSSREARQPCAHAQERLLPSEGAHERGQLFLRLLVGRRLRADLVEHRGLQSLAELVEQVPHLVFREARLRGELVVSGPREVVGGEVPLQHDEGLVLLLRLQLLADARDGAVEHGEGPRAVVERLRRLPLRRRVEGVLLREVASERHLGQEEVMHLVFGTQDVGRYVLLSELGRGGMGVVYRARDKSLGREIALKVLSAVGVTDEMLDRFQREARAAALLDHDGIVQVLDVGVLPPQPGDDRGRPFYAMEMLQGEDLAHAIGANRVEPRMVVEVVRQVALALAYAHGKGILHRDVKPANIWLRRGGAGDSPTVPGETRRESKPAPVYALLLDFGLAKLLDKGVSDTTVTKDLGGWMTLTESGQLLGTPVYMAPEQVGGARDVDGRADVYSLGATLYHAITGRPPFTGLSLTCLLDAVRKDDPTPPRRMNRTVSRDLETICLKCLEKEPARRYATAAALAEDCRRYLAGLPLLAKPAGPTERGMRWARRNPLLAAFFAVAIMFVALMSYRYVGPARISLTTDPPNATATVNGRPLGSGHWVWPIGSLLVRVEADGYEPKEMIVELPVGATVELGRITLAPDHGFLTIASPPGAEVWIDGLSTGRQTPLEGLRVRNGLHRLELRAPDRPTERDVFEISPGKITEARR